MAQVFETKMEWVQLDWETTVPSVTTLAKWVNAFNEAEPKGDEKDSIRPVGSKRLKQKDLNISDSSESSQSSKLPKKQRLSNRNRPEWKESLSPSKRLRHESAAPLDLSPRRSSQRLASWLFIVKWIFCTRRNRSELLRLWCWNWEQYSLMMSCAYAGLYRAAEETTSSIRCFVQKTIHSLVHTRLQKE